MDRVKALLKRHWPLLVVLLVGLILYGHSLNNGFVDDDTSQIADNPYLGSYSYDLRPVYSTTYHRPLMFMLFTSIDILFGKNPFWYHLPQILLFLASIVLLYILFCKFFGRRIATVLSLIFAIHPINVDAVAYISHIQDVMFVFFGLVALLLVRRWPAERYRMLAASTGLLVFASVFSKESGVLWVPLLVLYAYLFKSKVVKPVALGALAGAALYGLFLLVAPHGDMVTNNLVGPLAHLSLWQRLVSVPAILWFYVRTFLWPANLNIAYGWSVNRIGSPHFWGPLVADMVFLAGLVFAGYVIRRRRPQRLKLYIFFAAWFAIGIAAVLQLFPLDVTVAERWFYLPMIGLLGLLGTLASTLQWRSLKPVFQSLTLAIFIIVAGAMFVRTYVRISNFSNNLNLLRHDTAANETSYRIYNELAILLEREGKDDEAANHYLKSLAIQKQANNAWAGLGTVAVDHNNLQAAEYFFANSVKYDADYDLGYYNLATAYINENRPADAVKVLQAGLKRWPNDPPLKARLLDAKKLLADTQPKASTSNN